MPSYSVAGADIVAGADPQTLINLFSTAGGGRGYIEDIIIGSGATPADQANNFEVQRTTAVGTEGSGITPVSKDPDVQASSLDGAEGHSVEPTETASSLLLAFSVNQRATFRWVASPDGELIIPATTANGINIARRSGTAQYVLDCTFHFRE